MEKLKPCRWCGSKDAVVYTCRSGQQVQCCDCGACGPDAGTHEEAIEAWNTRAPETPLPATS